MPSIQLRTLTEQNSDRVRLASLEQSPLLDMRRSIQLPATNSVDMNVAAVMGLIAQIDLTVPGTYALASRLVRRAFLVELHCCSRESEWRRGYH